jgi:hypothetical protein
VGQRLAWSYRARRPGSAALSSLVRTSRQKAAWRVDSTGRTHRGMALFRFYQTWEVSADLRGLWSQDAVRPPVGGADLALTGLAWLCYDLAAYRRGSPLPPSIPR